MVQKKEKGSKKPKGILWAALLLSLLMPFGIYFALQNGQILLAVIAFVLLAAGYTLSAWKG